MARRVALRDLAPPTAVIGYLLHEQSNKGSSKMRHGFMLAALLLPLAGCYVPPDSSGYGYAQPGYAVTPTDPYGNVYPGYDYNDGAPTLYVDGAVMPLIFFDGGWGYYDRGRSWHRAPDNVSRNLEQRRAGGGAYRSGGQDYRQPHPSFGGQEHQQPRPSFGGQDPRPRPPQGGQSNSWERQGHPSFGGQDHQQPRPSFGGQDPRPRPPQGGQSNSWESHGHPSQQVRPVATPHDAPQQNQFGQQ
jgi:hypothetical protein